MCLHLSFKHAVVHTRQCMPSAHPYIPRIPTSVLQPLQKTGAVACSVRTCARACKDHVEHTAHKNTHAYVLAGHATTKRHHFTHKQVGMCSCRSHHHFTQIHTCMCSYRSRHHFTQIQDLVDLVRNIIEGMPSVRAGHATTAQAVRQIQAQVPLVWRRDNHKLFPPAFR